VPSIHEKAARLRALHTDPDLLILVNVWDVASAREVASASGCQAIATASAAIAASFGYDDGERIPPALMFGAIGRIAAAVDLPVTADVEAGYGDPGDTVSRAIAAGAVGGNLEDQLRPIPEAAAAVRAAVAAADAEGVGFVLNARTDAFLRASDRPHADVLADTIERGHAYLEEGAGCVFVPGRLDIETIRVLAAEFGPGRLSLLGLPGVPPPGELAAAGVARLSYGPLPQGFTLGVLGDLAASLLSGTSMPDRPAVGSS